MKKLDQNSSKEDEESPSTMCMPIDETDSSKINLSLEESDLKFKLFADRLEFERFIIEKEYDCQNKNRKRLRIWNLLMRKEAFGCVGIPARVFRLLAAYSDH